MSKSAVAAIDSILHAWKQSDDENEALITTAKETAGKITTAFDELSAEVPRLGHQAKLWKSRDWYIGNKTHQNVICVYTLQIAGVRKRSVYIEVQGSSVKLAGQSIDAADDAAAWSVTTQVVREYFAEATTQRRNGEALAAPPY